MKASLPKQIFAGLAVGVSLGALSQVLPNPRRSATRWSPSSRSGRRSFDWRR